MYETTHDEPLVSVVTPVYNGAPYIESTIRSVLAQTHGNFEYVVFDNASTDNTLNIATRFANADSRLRVVTREKTLGIMGNWNAALAGISPDSEFVKIIHADDLLYPRCLEVMVKAAQRDANIGIVSAYRTEGDRVTIHGIDAEPGLLDGTLTTAISGKEAVARVFRREAALFGSPSALLLRSSIVRRRPEFYDEAMLHADTDACMRELMNCDLAFVHETLTYTRRHDGSLSTQISRLGTPRIERLVMMARYGATCMGEEQFEKLWKRSVELQQRFLVRGLLEGRGRIFWQYQTQALTALGLMPGRTKLIRDLARVVRNPGRLFSHFMGQPSWSELPTPEDISSYLRWVDSAANTIADDV